MPRYRRLILRDGPLFEDRQAAGQALAARLLSYAGADVVVLAIPRGGVPVAAEVARRLGAELDVIVARKLGAPQQRELAIGAVTANGGRYLNQELIAELALTGDYLSRITEGEMAESRRREALYRSGRPAAHIEGRTVILVDDGLATGATMRAAARSVRSRKPARLVIAVPIGASETCEALAEEAGDVVCLHCREPFYAVGLHYVRFGQTSDDEVQRILREFQALTPGGEPATASAPPAGSRRTSRRSRGVRCPLAP
jgi:predicted phosphoribosyltransferase